MDKPGGHRTGLNAHFGVDTSVLRNTSRNWPGIGGADAAPEPPALLVDNADRGRLLRYVQPDRLLGFAPQLPEVHIWRMSVMLDAWRRPPACPARIGPRRSGDLGAITACTMR